MPPILEVGAATGAGRLTFMLAWAAALRPDLLAILDVPVDHGARLYPPALIAAGLPPACRPVIVRPPTGPGDTTPRAIVDALFILLRSEAFDAILCPFPAGARLSTATATTLASMAARAGSALFVATTGPGVTGRGAAPRALLGPSAAFRLVLADHRWAWRDGELAGLSLEVRTYRARGAAGAALISGAARLPLSSRESFQAGGAYADNEGPRALATHVLDFRLRRPARDGPSPNPAGFGGIAWEVQGIATGGLARRHGDAPAGERRVLAV